MGICKEKNKERKLLDTYRKCLCVLVVAKVEKRKELSWMIALWKLPDSHDLTNLEDKNDQGSPNPSSVRFAADCTCVQKRGEVSFWGGGTEHFCVLA